MGGLRCKIWQERGGVETCGGDGCEMRTVKEKEGKKNH